MFSNFQQPDLFAAQDFILFAQHGWADTDRDISHLARLLIASQSAEANIPSYTPDLGWIDTWLTIAPLVTKVENIAAEAIAKYPDLPLRIIGHSMGGLIWLEILDRHREWWGKVHSLVLIGSPIGGSDLGRLFDPFRLFPLMARDLGTNRRPIAEAIAAQVPTLSIVGDIGNHTDGTVPIGCSQFAYANFVSLDGLRHPTLKNHPRVAEAIHRFWKNPAIGNISPDTASQLIARFRAIDLTETSNQNFQYAKLIKTYPDGTKLWLWRNPLQVIHVFVSRDNLCLYSAYTGWLDARKLRDLIY